MTHPDHGGQWYARRCGTVRGPFTEEYIARYILLGRIRLNDELSRDRVRWRPASDCQDLFPKGLLQLSSREDSQKLVAARMKVDERISQRRRGREKAPLPACEERRTRSDRRYNDSDAKYLEYHLMEQGSHHSRGSNNTEIQPLRTFLLATLLVTLVFAYFSISNR